MIRLQLRFSSPSACSKALALLCFPRSCPVLILSTYLGDAMKRGIKNVTVRGNMQEYEPRESCFADKHRCRSISKSIGLVSAEAASPPGLPLSNSHYVNQDITTEKTYRTRRIAPFLWPIHRRPAASKVLELEERNFAQYRSRSFGEFSLG